MTEQDVINWILEGYTETDFSTDKPTPKNLRWAIDECVDAFRWRVEDDIYVYKLFSHLAERLEALSEYLRKLEKGE